jgi:WD40-like Beta Propeller Repeat
VTFSGCSPAREPLRYGRSQIHESMAGSDLRREGRALTVGVALAVAVAGLGLVVLALRPDSAGRPTSEALLSQTGVVGAARANGLIAFGCGYHICTMSPDGTNITDLTKPDDPNIVLAAYDPVWSPDGTKIAFYGYPRGAVRGGANYDVYVMNADGSGVPTSRRARQMWRAGSPRGVRSGPRIRPGSPTTVTMACTS